MHELKTLFFLSGWWELSESKGWGGECDRDRLYTHDISNQQVTHCLLSLSFCFRLWQFTLRLACKCVCLWRMYLWWSLYTVYLLALRLTCKCVCQILWRMYLWWSLYTLYLLALRLTCKCVCQILWRMYLWWSLYTLYLLTLRLTCKCVC